MLYSRRMYCIGRNSWRRMRLILRSLLYRYLNACTNCTLYKVYNLEFKNKSLYLENLILPVCFKWISFMTIVHIYMYYEITYVLTIVHICINYSSHIYVLWVHICINYSSHMYYEFTYVLTIVHICINYSSHMYYEFTKRFTFYSNFLLIAKR